MTRFIHIFFIADEKIHFIILKANAFDAQLYCCAANRAYICKNKLSSIFTLCIYNFMGKMHIFNDMQLALKLKNDEITESTMWKYFIASIAFSPIFDFFTGILLCFLSRHITLQDYVIGGNFAQLMINPISIAIHIFAIYLIRNTNLGFAKSVQYYACLSLPAAIRMALIYICLLLFTDLMDSSIRDSNGEINKVVYSVWMFCFEVFPVFYFYRRILICFRLISA